MSDQTASVECPVCKEQVESLPVHLASAHPDQKPGPKAAKPAAGSAASGAFSRTGGSSSAADPSRSGRDRDTEDTYTAIELPILIVDERPDQRPVEVGHRGNIYELPRGRRIVVAEGVLSTLRNAVLVDYELRLRPVESLPDMEAAHDLIEKPVELFPSIQEHPLTEAEARDARRLFEQFRVRQVSRLSAGA